MKGLRGKPAKRLENLTVIDPISRCHFFIGYLTKDSYGMFAYGGRARLAHRAAWLIHRGPIPDGLHVMHNCDNPQCVNVEHLSLGTRTDNMRDMQAKGRKVILKREKHPRAKLNSGIAFSIRWHDAAGIKTVENAKIHSTSRQLVHQICKNQIWQQECHD